MLLGFQVQGMNGILLQRLSAFKLGVERIVHPLERSANLCCFSVPWFKHLEKEWIERYAQAYRKVIENYEQLLEHDADKSQGGRWYGQSNE